MIAIGVHPGKAPLFSAEERAALLHETCGPVAQAEGAVLEIVTFNDLAVVGGPALRRRDLHPRPARRHRSRLRDAARRHERRHGAGGPDHVPARLHEARPITATLVRQIAGMGGDVSPFVPAAVAARLRQRFAAKS